VQTIADIGIALGHNSPSPQVTPRRSLSDASLPATRRSLSDASLPAAKRSLSYESLSIASASPVDYVAVLQEARVCGESQQEAGAERAKADSMPPESSPISSHEYEMAEPEPLTVTVAELPQVPQADAKDAADGPQPAPGSGGDVDESRGSIGAEDVSINERPCDRESTGSSSHAKLMSEASSSASGAQGEKSRREPEPETEPRQGDVDEPMPQSKRKCFKKRSRSVNFEQLYSQVLDLDFEPRPEDRPQSFAGVLMPSCAQSMNLERWTPKKEPVSAELMGSRLSRRDIQNSYSKVRELEQELEMHQEELACLQQKLKSLTVDRAPESRQGVHDLKEQCHALSKLVEALTAQALECSCSDRNMMGAMEVFQQGNALLDSVAELLKQLARAASESEAPEGCDAKEWRIVQDTIGCGPELEALRDLLSRVSASVCTKSEGELALSQQPAVLLRFLRAQEGNVDDAARVFLDSVQWRESYSLARQWAEWCAEIAAQTTWRSQLVERFKVHTVLGKDRFGVNAYLFRWGVFDAAGAERELGAEMVLKIMLFIHEDIAASMREAMLARDELNPGALYIWDIGDYSRYGGPSQWWKRMMSLVRFLPKVAGLMASNYPEVVRKIMVVRAGVTARALHHAVAALLPAKTLGKVRMYGWYSDEWRNELQQEIPDCSSLPPFLLCEDAEALRAAQPAGGMYPRA